MRARKDALLGARVRAIAEQIGAGKQEAPPTRAPTILKIPLSEIGQDGIHLGLSMTGTHFCIKLDNPS